MKKESSLKFETQADRMYQLLTHYMDGDEISYYQKRRLHELGLLQMEVEKVEFGRPRHLYSPVRKTVRGLMELWMENLKAQKSAK